MDVHGVVGAYNDVLGGVDDERAGYPAGLCRVETIFAFVKRQMSERGEVDVSLDWYHMYVLTPPPSSFRSCYSRLFAPSLRCHCR